MERRELAVGHSPEVNIKSDRYISGSFARTRSMVFSAVVLGLPMFVHSMRSSPFVAPICHVVNNPAHVRVSLRRVLRHNVLRLVLVPDFKGCP